MYILLLFRSTDHHSHLLHQVSCLKTRVSPSDIIDSLDRLRKGGVVIICTLQVSRSPIMARNSQGPYFPCDAGRLWPIAGPGPLVCTDGAGCGIECPGYVLYAPWLIRCYADTCTYRSIFPLIELFGSAASHPSLLHHGGYQVASTLPRCSGGRRCLACTLVCPWDEMLDPRLIAL